MSPRKPFKSIGFESSQLRFEINSGKGDKSSRRQVGILQNYKVSRKSAKPAETAQVASKKPAFLK
jgi:hypothetical protein